jgi:site-specific recombinase XerD
VCSKWELHKFRKTFATVHHESGVSARTLQAWLGHSDLETTLPYLKVADMRSERTREQVNHSFAGFA